MKDVTYHHAWMQGRHWANYTHMVSMLWRASWLFDFDDGGSEVMMKLIWSASAAIDGFWCALNWKQELLDSSVRRHVPGGAAVAGGLMIKLLLYIGMLCNIYSMSQGSEMREYTATVHFPNWNIP